MRIGQHRPLFCLCAVRMLAAGLGCVLSGFDGHRMLPAGAVCAGLAAGVLSVCLLLRLLRRITARRACAVGLALLCAGLSLPQQRRVLFRAGHAGFLPGLPADSGIPASDGAGRCPDLPDAADAPVWEVRAVVAERLGGGSRITDYGPILRTVQGEPVGSALRPARAYLLCTYAANLQPGYEILLRAQAVTPEDAAEESAVSLRGDGYALGLLSGREDDCTVTAESTDLLPIRLGNLRRHPAARLEAAVGTDGLGLPSALLLGDRTALSPTLRRDFSRAGVSHLLAVSGLHLTLLFGMLALLLRFSAPAASGARRAADACRRRLPCAVGIPAVRDPRRRDAGVRVPVVAVRGVCRSADLAGAGWRPILGISPAPWQMPDSRCPFPRRWGFDGSSCSAGFGQTPACPAPACAARPDCAGVCRTAGAFRWTCCHDLFAVDHLAHGRYGEPVVAACHAAADAAVRVRACRIAVRTAAGGAVGWRDRIAPGIAARLRLDGRMRRMAGQADRRGAFPGAAADGRCHPCGHPCRDAVPVAVAVSESATADARSGTAPGGGRLGGGSAAGVPARAGISGEVLTSYIRPTASSRGVGAGARAGGCHLSDPTDGSRTAPNAALDEAGSLGATGSVRPDADPLPYAHGGRTAPCLRGGDRACAVALRPTVPEDYYRMLSCLYEARRQGVPVCLYEPGDTLTAFDSGGGGISLTLYTDRLERSAQPVLLLHAAGQGSALTFCGGAVFESDLAGIARTLCGGQ